MRNAELNRSVLLGLVFDVAMHYGTGHSKPTVNGLRAPKKHPAAVEPGVFLALIS